jgi:hypothetical protein
MTVRTWITTVEAASLIWLDEERRLPPEELRDWLVEQFVAQLAVTAGHDAETAGVLRDAAALEPSGGRVDELLERTFARLAPARA